MREKLRFLGLAVHVETIAVAVAEPGGEGRSLGTIANREDSIRRFIKKLGSPEQLSISYEAGATGFVLYPPSYLPEIRRTVSGRMFSFCIQAARENAGLSIGKTAGLSGMEISEWAAEHKTPDGVLF